MKAEVCILYSHDNDRALQQPNQPNKHFNLREHIQLFYTALHDRNILVDFARPAEDLSAYRLVFAPSLHLLAGGEADRLKLFVQNDGTLDKELTDEALNEFGYKSIEEVAQKLVNGEVEFSQLNGIKPFFRMHPPKKGFKRSVKRPYNDRGELGYRGDEINELIKRMC